VFAVAKDKFPNCSRKQKYIAFRNGRLLSDDILKWIIDAAMRGLMTPSGAKLLLIPDTRKGPPDISGLRYIGKFKKSDCLTLKQLVSRNRQSKTSRKSSKMGEKK